MAVDEVEYLPVGAGECIKCCLDPAVADALTIGERELGGPLIGNVVFARVKEGEGFGKIPSSSRRQRRSARSRPGLIAVQAFPAPEREQPGPHPAGILQASG